ncbi:MAG: hypothetical protein VX794_01680 [Nitrospinota bacterium]|nr:hypothetical protein [Nitrospinota bacterium]
MKVESILAKLNDLRKDCKGEEEIEQAVYHVFCFVSYEVNSFANFIEKDIQPTNKISESPISDNVKKIFQVFEELKDEISDDEEDLEFIALDLTLKFLSFLTFDFQEYLRKI